MYRLCVLLFLVLLAWAHPKDFFFKEPRIFNGTAATPGQFPWQALVYAQSSSLSWVCGAVVLSEDWILTSGFCIYEITFASVFTGTVDLNSGTTSFPNDLIIHEGLTAFHNNIGLIKLNSSLIFDDFTKAIALSSDFLDASENVTASGFGITSDGDEEITSDILNYIALVTISNEDCSKIYNFPLSDEIVCAVSDPAFNKSLCTGDVGGPLVKNPDSDPVLVGIGSFVPAESCEAGYPSGFTRIEPNVDWIRNTTGI